MIQLHLDGPKMTEYQKLKINKTRFKRIIKQLCNENSVKKATLSFIYVSESELLHINKKYLNHSTHTDIITFDLSDNENEIEGEIYISIDRVKENANKFLTNEKAEMLRVMFHGCLHLLGYKDKTVIEQKNMREAENRALTLYLELSKQ